ncbi:MAG: SCO family protein [Vicinamibacteraceae bacterium]
MAAVVGVTSGCTQPSSDGAAGRMLPGGSAGPGTPPAAPVLPPGGEFSLSGPGGKPYALADARGSAVVLFFGYASCPDFCPRAMGLVKTALSRLDPAQAARVQPIFVSVDPERDTPDSLERYLRNLVGTPTGGRRPIGVTGTPAALHEVIGRYGADYERDPAAPGAAYTVSHPTSLFIVDPNGQLRAIVSTGDGVDPLVAALRQVL